MRTKEIEVKGLEHKMLRFYFRSSAISRAFRPKTKHSLFFRLTRKFGLESLEMPPKDCRVVMTDPQGVKRSVQVTADSLFEAAALAVYAFKKDGFTDFIANVFTVEITEPVVKHQVSVGQLKSWLNGNVSDPRERIRREKLKAMVG